MQALLDADITNMTVVRNNSKNDDGVDTVATPDWFTFNQSPVSSLCISGNSWIGITSSTENVKVNRRDAASWYVYTEEGTVCLEPFFKIRWRGYSYYSSTSSSYLLEYDVVFLKNGGIYIHMINIPTSYNDGVYALVADTTYTYSVSSDVKDISFYYNSETNSYELKYEVYSINYPYKLLLKSNDLLYTIQDNSLVQLVETELTNELFETYGFTSINTSLIMQLENVEILMSSNTHFSIKSIITGVSNPKSIVLEDISLVGPNSNGIKSISYIGSDDILLQVSFDKQTWYKYEIEFTEITDEFEGTELSVVKEIPESVWGSFCGDHTVAYIKLIFSSLSQYLTSISISI